MQGKYTLTQVNANFLAVTSKHLTKNGYNGTFSMKGYIKCMLNHENGDMSYHTNPNEIDTEWIILVWNILRVKQV